MEDRLACPAQRHNAFNTDLEGARHWNFSGTGLRRYYRHAARSYLFTKAVTF